LAYFFTTTGVGSGEVVAVSVGDMSAPWSFRDAV